VCATFVYGMKFDDDNRTQAVGFDAIKPEHWHAQCEICDSKEGAVAVCGEAANGCKHVFHASCGITREREAKDYSFTYVEVVEGGQKPQAMCPEHLTKEDDDGEDVLS